MTGKSLFAPFLLWVAAIIPAPAQKADYQKADSQRVASLFQKARGQRKAMGSYMVFFGRQLRGVPYVAKTLEVNREERLVVNLRQLDCTTYVETVLALSRCMMQGKPTFANFCTPSGSSAMQGGWSPTPHASTISPIGLNRTPPRAS